MVVVIEVGVRVVLNVEVKVTTVVMSMMAEAGVRL